MLLHAYVAFVADRRAARARWNADAHLLGDSERTQEFHLRRQIAEALAEEQRRGPGGKRFRADALRSGASDIDVEARGDNRFVLVVLVELVFETRRDIIEPALALAIFRLNLLVQRAQADAEVLGHPLRHVDGEVGLVGCRLVTASGQLSICNRRQRELVGNKGIFDHQRRGEEALAGETVRPRQIVP